MAGVVGSNPTRPNPILTLYLGPHAISPVYHFMPLREERDPLSAFTYALKAPETSRQYPRRLKVFFDFMQSDNPLGRAGQTISHQGKK